MGRAWMAVLLVTGCFGGNGGTQSSGAEDASVGQAGDAGTVSVGGGSTSTGSSSTDALDAATPPLPMLPVPMTMNPGMSVPFPPLPMVAPDAGTPTFAATGEGALCQVDGDCDSTLRCGLLPAPFAGVCGRGCLMSTECDVDETCALYSQFDTQGLCLGTVGPWEVYAYTDLTMCAPGTFGVSVSAKLSWRPLSRTVFARGR